MDTKKIKKVNAIIDGQLFQLTIRQYPDGKEKVLRYRPLGKKSPRFPSKPVKAHPKRSVLQRKTKNIDRKAKLKMRY